MDNYTRRARNPAALDDLLRYGAILTYRELHLGALLASGISQMEACTELRITRRELRALSRNAIRKIERAIAAGDLSEKSVTLIEAGISAEEVADSA